MSVSIPLVSIVIPTYNRAKYLREAIQSVLEQSFLDFELVIADNGSEDETGSVIQSFDDERIVYVKHPCNMGSWVNWTYGVHMTRGQFVSILGDDDRYKRDFLMHRINQLRCHPSAVAVFSPYEICDELGMVIKTSPRYKERESVIKGSDLVLCVEKGFWTIVSALYRRDFLLQEWHKGSRAGHACDFAINLSLAARDEAMGVWIPSADATYRNHQGQDTSLNFKEVVMDRIWTYTYFLKHGLGKGREHEAILKSGLAWAYNALGRAAWNGENVRMARHYSYRALQAHPVNREALLRLAKTFILPCRSCRTALKSIRGKTRP